MARPDSFLPLAQESGLIRPITDQIIERVMRDMGAMLAADRSLHIAINLAASEVCSGRFLPGLQQHMKSFNVLPGQVWLETTEGGYMHHQSAKLTLRKARALGHIAAVEDFDIGSSSLQSMGQLPLDALKIDKAFVNGIGMDGSVESLVSDVIEMATTLKLFVVAEGVETREQLDYLRAYNVHFAQGDLFAKALPIEAFEQYYRGETEDCREARDVFGLFPSFGG
ncbi:hypothetical protein GCM10017655_16110 [Pseudomonas turukhanskensis]|uniref:EAL domain-containing protein n=2 Tax=Pseudomonas turukhanskensis TaxID=1806536 RepID=A0A9W6K6T4_9PSED|nr:hypothetical protein GCM10017655_16110 [Pseudomonas turukhanskensis]